MKSEGRKAEGDLSRQGMGRGGGSFCRVLRGFALDALDLGRSLCAAFGNLGTLKTVGVFLDVFTGDTVVDALLLGVRIGVGSSIFATCDPSSSSVVNRSAEIFRFWAALALGTLVGPLYSSSSPVPSSENKCRASSYTLLGRFFRRLLCCLPTAEVGGSKRVFTSIGDNAVN